VSPHKEEEPPTSEGSSLKSVRESEDSVVHPPPPTRTKYIPGDDGGSSGQWAKMPASALELRRPEMRVLFAYSQFANKWRISMVGENRIAEELGWYYGPKRLPNRRNVKKARDRLIADGFMVEAGPRRVPGTKNTWVKSYLVAPYDDASRMNASLVGTMRRFGDDDASFSNTTMRRPATHIQRFTEQKMFQGSGDSREEDQHLNGQERSGDAPWKGYQGGWPAWLKDAAKEEAEETPIEARAEVPI